MTIDDFIESATPYAADRGQWYYESGALHDFVKHNDQHFSATVKALTNDFPVALHFDAEGHITNYQCNCSKQDVLCKHIVALAFQIAFDPELNKMENSEEHEAFLEDLRKDCDERMAQLKEKNETPTALYNPLYNLHKESSKFEIE